MTNTNQQIEIWKDIPNYEGHYQVSNLGRVKSLKYGKERILKQSVCAGGYRGFSLHKNGKQKSRLVHVLVAMAFLGHVPCRVLRVVDHKNHIRSDNRLCNLQIITQRKNTNQKHLKSSSAYTGVFRCSGGKKWRSQILINGKRRKLGSFVTELEASQYYENALIAHNNGKQIIVKKAIVTSKYKGVSWHKISRKWVAQIAINGKKINLGYFTNEIDASNAYQKALKSKNQ